MKVNILMSTYNGEAYLREQLDSIRNQSFQDWYLLIRDDGSKDQTREIIKDYVGKDSRITWIDQEDQTNLGVIKSFHRLLKYERADYFCFSDQDDVWLPDKLEEQIKIAQTYPTDRPLLVYMDLKVVDENLQVLDESMIRSQSHHANTSLEAILIENTVTGGVTLINQTLADLWERTDNLIMHDWYLAILAAALGDLVYLDQAGELYRQHGYNVVGAKTQERGFKIFHQGPKRIYRRYWKHIHEIQAQAQTALEEMESSLSSTQRNLLEDWISLDRVGFWERLKRLRTHGYRKNKTFHDLVFKSLILTKIYHH